MVYRCEEVMHMLSIYDRLMKTLVYKEDKKILQGAMNTAALGAVEMGLRF
jgi:hypothetical protein